MTQTTFAFLENPVTSGKLNQAVQGYRFIMRRSIYAGLPEPFIHRCMPRASSFYARLIGPGGGGAGAPGGDSTTSSAGGGGGAGGYKDIFQLLSDIAQSPLTILAPMGASGGAPGASPGTTASSGAAILYPGFLALQTLAIAFPGQGGIAMPIGNSLSFVGGGLGGLGGSDGIAGESGGVGIRFSLGVTVSGKGGNSLLGGGAAESMGESPGQSARSYGAGGGGAASRDLPMPGGPGGDAVVIIDEYY